MVGICWLEGLTCIGGPLATLTPGGVRVGSRNPAWPAVIHRPGPLESISTAIPAASCGERTANSLEYGAAVWSWDPPTWEDRASVYGVEGIQRLLPAPPVSIEPINPSTPKRPAAIQQGLLVGLCRDRHRRQIEDWSDRDRGFMKPARASRRKRRATLKPCRSRCKTHDGLPGNRDRLRQESISGQLCVPGPFSASSVKFWPTHTG